MPRRSSKIMKTDNILKILSKVISVLLYPMFIPTYGMILFCLWLHQTSPILPSYYYFVLLGITAFFTCIAPLLWVVYLVYTKRITDIYLENPSERRMPYIGSWLYALIWCYLLNILGISAPTLYIFVGAMVAFTVLIVVNRWWKMSAHLTFWGILTGGVAAYAWLMSFNPIWLLTSLFVGALLLMYARLYLKQHTPLQVVVGFLTGFVLTFSPVLLILI